MTKTNRTILSPAARYKAQAEAHAALLYYIIRRYEDESGLWCVHCQRIIKPMRGHDDDCIIRMSKRALADDAGIAPNDTSEGDG